MSNVTEPPTLAAADKILAAHNGWPMVPLRQVLTSLETGSRPPGGAIGITAGIPSLSAEHMTRFGTFDFSSLRYVPRDYYEEMPRGRVRRNDILIVKDGATTGKVAFVDEHFPFDEAVVNEHVFLCRPNQEIINARLLFYWLWGTGGQSAIRANFQGAAIGGINQSFVDAVHVPVPNPEMQMRLVQIIREKLTVADKALAACIDKFAAVQRLRDASIRSVFESELVRASRHATIAEIASLVIDGPHVTPNYVPAGIPFITVRNIVNRKLDFSKTSFITPEDHATFSSRGRAEIGDILYTKDGTLGVPCLVDDDRPFSFFVSVALIKLLRHFAVPKFVTYALDSPRVLNQVEHLAAGAGLKHMVLKSIRKLSIPLPPLHVQSQIAEQLETKLNAVNIALSAVSTELDTIQRLPAALLREAFSGRL